MSDDIYPLRLPSSIKAAALRMAEADGVSLDQWITAVVAEKVDTVDAVTAFLKRRAAGASDDAFARTLAKVPDVEPIEGDELPEHLQ